MRLTDLVEIEFRDTGTYVAKTDQKVSITAGSEVLASRVLSYTGPGHNKKLDIYNTLMSSEDMQDYYNRGFTGYELLATKKELEKIMNEGKPGENRGQLKFRAIKYEPVSSPTAANYKEMDKFSIE